MCIRDRYMGLRENFRDVLSQCRTVDALVLDDANNIFLSANGGATLLYYNFSKGLWHPIDAAHFDVGFLTQAFRLDGLPNVPPGKVISAELSEFDAFFEFLVDQPSSAINTTALRQDLLQALGTYENKLLVWRDKGNRDEYLKTLLEYCVRLAESREFPRLRLLLTEILSGESPSVSFLKEKFSARSLIETLRDHLRRRSLAGEVLEELEQLLP
eukprot:TRINITY_DN4291_c0_g1_i2.p1 TRINITY_DN4291_c0_g1~~TRINITY_DN4291_c0_g1_i2.p1  ORF type:complete len:234 (+),score=58.22 TRINITY_DN4291_c0_g1_i2:61-702(+)